MPRVKRSNIGRQSRNARSVAYFRVDQTEDDRTLANELRRIHISQLRATRTSTERHRERETDIWRHRLNPNHSNRNEWNTNRRERRSNVNVDLNQAAFHYDSTIDYSVQPCVTIGPMDVVCQYCNALRFSNETPGLCCAGGKVKLPPLTPPPEPLRSLLYGEAQQSKHFLANIQQYNGCFQMTSFGAEIIEERGFNPTFKVISSRQIPLGNYANRRNSSISHL